MSKQKIKDEHLDKLPILFFEIVLDKHDLQIFHFLVGLSDFEKDCELEVAESGLIYDDIEGEDKQDYWIDENPSWLHILPKRLLHKIYLTFGLLHPDFGFDEDCIDNLKNPKKDKDDVEILER